MFDAKKWRVENREKVSEYNKYYRNTSKGREKRRIASRKDRKNNPEKHFWYRVKYKYGITKVQWLKLLEKQGGGCKVCGATTSRNGRRLHIDHSHITGKVRGLLCDTCNLTLGNYEKHPEWLRGLASYIGEHE